MTLENELSRPLIIKGFLSDGEVLQITQFIRDQERLTDPKCCVWYKSISLLDNPDAKQMCHDICDGYGSGCYFAMYTPKGKYVVIDVNVSQGNYD